MAVVCVTEKTMRTKRYKLSWMRSRLQVSEEVAEVYAT